MPDGEKMTKCLCPKCGKHHRMWLLWIGKGVPRIYCHVCKHQHELSAETIYPDPRGAFQELEDAC